MIDVLQVACLAVQVLGVLVGIPFGMFLILDRWGGER